MFRTTGKRLRKPNLLFSLFVVLLFTHLESVAPYTAPSANNSPSRRVFLSQAAVTSSVVFTSVLATDPTPAIAARSSGPTVEDDLQTLSDGADALGSLLGNWDRATVDCTYADVPRELLETKNKELLLEKAMTSALFDKSASVVSCKKNNRIVRDYIGATGKGPLVGAEKRMLRRAVADRVDPDRLDDYYSEVEAFSQAISRASILSYTAGMSDLDAVNNFEKGEERASGDDTNLEQAKRAIGEAKLSLDKVIDLLKNGSEQVV